MDSLVNPAARPFSPAERHQLVATKVAVDATKDTFVWVTAGTRNS